MTFILLISATVLGTVLYRKNSLMKVCFAYMLTWLYHATLFYMILVVGTVLYREEPMFDKVLVFWANVVNLHVTLAMLFTFLSLLGFSRESIISLVKGK